MLRVLKLITGDEIVGNVISNDSVKGCVISNPLTITYMQSRFGNNPVIYLQRYVPFTSQEDMTIKSDHIVAVLEPVQGMEEYYETVLATIRETVDTNIVSNLMDAAETKSLKTKGDMYRAILEGMETRGPKH